MCPRYAAVLSGFILLLLLSGCCSGSGSAVTTTTTRQTGLQGIVYTRTLGGPLLPSGEFTHPPYFPTADATITVRTTAGSVVATTVTNAAGAYSLFLPPGAYRLSVTVHAEDAQSALFAGTASATIPEQGILQQDLSLDIRIP